MALPDERVESRPATEAATLSASGYRDYAFVVTSWFGCWGMQGVLFSWLVVGELGAPAELVGVAQLAIVLPALAFLLVAGATADRIDRRRLQIGLHAAAAALIGGLALVVASGALRFSLLIGYALGIGTISAFLAPARDATLYDVAGRDLMRAVVGVTLIQFVAQGLGSFAAGGARYFGAAAMLALQAAIVFSGTFFLRRLPSSDPNAHHTEPPALREIASGIVEVLRSSTLRPVWLLTLGVGFFFQGSYFVVYPLLVRDFYQGSVDQLALLTGSFPIGVVMGSLLLLRGRSLRPRGRALVLAQLAAALCLLVTALGVPYPVAVAAGTGWGLCGAVFLNVGRTLFQEQAPVAQRGRVLSVYPLGVFAAGSLGSPASGVLAGALGPLGAFAVCGAGMMVFVAIIVSTTKVGRIE